MRALATEGVLVRIVPTMQPGPFRLKRTVVRGLGYVSMLEEKDLPLWVPVLVSQKIQITPMSIEHASMLEKPVTSLLPIPAVSVPTRAAILEEVVRLLFKRTLVSESKLVRTVPLMQPGDSRSKRTAAKDKKHVRKRAEQDLRLWEQILVMGKVRAIVLEDMASL